MANVGKNIRILRTKKGMTQDELAEKLFVSRQTVSNYENGKSNPDIDMLMKIAEVLDADANALIYGIPVKPDTKKERIRSLVLLAVLACLGILSGRTPQIIHRILIAVLSGSLILVLPGCFLMVLDTFTLMRLLNSHTDFNFSASYFDLIPVWDYFARNIFYCLFRIPSFLFLLPGAALWITKPRKGNESCA